MISFFWLVVLLGGYHFLLLYFASLYQISFIERKKKEFAILTTTRTILGYFLHVHWSIYLWAFFCSCAPDLIFFMYEIIKVNQSDRNLYVSKCRLFYLRAWRNKLLIWCSPAVPWKQSRLLQLNFHVFSCMKFAISVIIYICSNQLFSFSWTWWNRFAISLWYFIIFVTFLNLWAILCFDINLGIYGLMIKYRKQPVIPILAFILNESPSTPSLSTKEDNMAIDNLCKLGVIDIGSLNGR